MVFNKNISFSVPARGSTRCRTMVVVFSGTKFTKAKTITIVTYSTVSESYATKFAFFAILINPINSSL